ncbi:tRNA (guanine(46)-N(7))-methyltransferase TrmB [Nitrincola sp. MINF-07-Sa-05]|uniref:tRNA (guanine(46)-N(7))-methyltransferase TrmB n=1 Tax=Nitrincola salilacus TaxID=3400273 RepID=UPI003917B76F
MTKTLSIDTSSTDTHPEGNSRPVTSSQSDVHPGLAALLQRYRDAVFNKPVADFNQLAFDRASEYLCAHGGPLILDSGCGVGDSTRVIARNYPDHLVLGLDRSEDRLSRQRQPPLPDNAHLIRTDLVDFWRLAAAAEWKPEHHFLLYPNPYPKPQQLQRRFHGHPVFPHFVTLGGTIHCRSNWLIYLKELASALALYGVDSQITPVPNEPAMTPFEQKYRNSGQAVWQLLSAPPPDPGDAR